ncbi:NAD(P)-dependent oxidoreductase [Sphingomonas sp. BK235]|uniref:NAD(P)-dependent oxidoreductase n=1 Tax=Sphingomonas sp. BK235 TaxID=2512131 RepID=UPI00104DF92D|nr:NAD(P)-dependent oxidoreductase [Sphingomonas sp. BK235]TCP29683.1 hypothetical protein EV292_11634 [Sphingomonas sp. BK235]
MAIDPILLLGGSGAIGRRSAAALRAQHPDVPLLIGGRDRDRAEAAARALGQAEGVAIDPDAPDLGLGDRRVGAVAVFYADPRLAGLGYARARGLPHLGISSGIYEIAPEVAVYMQRPAAGAMVLGYEWLVGATTVATLTAARDYARVDTIAIGALVDSEDQGGPAVEEDFARLSHRLPAALTRVDGSWTWREGEDARAPAPASVRAADGRAVAGTGFSSIDVTGLAAATGARDVRFDLATGESSTRRRGGDFSTEIVIALAGTDARGAAKRSRHALIHPGGAAPLTALGVAMLLERLTGLDGAAPAAPGLYFPYQLIDHAAYLARLRAAGGALETLPD